MAMSRTRARPEASPSLDPPAEVREIARALERAGFETWCVGGAVRDALLGLPHLDWDLATAATPPEIKRTFRRTVPVGEQFGTIGVMDRRGQLHEVTTFRRDVQTDGRHAVVAFGASLDEDLSRRDFTINAIAYSPSRNVVHDPFGGRDDLAHGVVRAVGVARERMVEDRLRALRAMRFAGRFGFRIEPSTWAAIVESAPFLPRLSRERIKQELEKTMEQVSLPSRTLSLWRNAGAMRALIPLVDARPAWQLHAADLLARPDASAAAGRKRRRTLVRLATLFVGERHGAVAATLRDLRLSNRDVEWVAQLAMHATTLRDAVWTAIEAPGEGSDAEVRRWAAVAGRTRLADVLRVALATLAAERAYAARPDVMPDESSDGGASPLAEAGRWRARAVYRRALVVAYRDPVEVADLAVDGEDLMRDADVPRGPALGAALRYLRDVVVEEPSRNVRTTLLALARDWAIARKADTEEG
jgi:tRNA nucleotidyltransferase (CCA-adding enzyme)